MYRHIHLTFTPMQGLHSGAHLPKYFEFSKRSHSFIIILKENKGKLTFFILNFFALNKLANKMVKIIFCWASSIVDPYCLKWDVFMDSPSAICYTGTQIMVTLTYKEKLLLINRLGLLTVYVSWTGILPLNPSNSTLISAIKETWWDSLKQDENASHTQRFLSNQWLPWTSIFGPAKSEMYT